LIASQRKNAAQAALTMLQSRASDFMIAVNLREQVGRINRPKVSQADFFRVRCEVGIPERFVSGDGRGLAIFTRPGEPVPFRKFRNGQRAFRPHLAAIDRSDEISLSTVSESQRSANTPRSLNPLLWLRRESFQPQPSSPQTER
jgi:hypothetical protein